jgi:hypothetical protein
MLCARSLDVISVLLDIFVFAAQFFYSSRTTTRLGAANLPETKMSAAHQKGERRRFFISEGPHISKSSSGSSGYIDPGVPGNTFQRAKHL